MRLTSVTNQRSSSHSAIPSPVCAKGTSTSSATSPAGTGAAEASLANHLPLPANARRHCTAQEKSRPHGPRSEGQWGGGRGTLTSASGSRANEEDAAVAAKRSGERGRRRRCSGGEGAVGLASRCGSGGCFVGRGTTGIGRGRRRELEASRLQAMSLLRLVCYSCSGVGIADR
jgi:hypothetical protein